MQTFLPYPNFALSASVLDYRRLDKQRVEAKQIYLALTSPKYGWQNHPAVKMWRGYHEALLYYGMFMCQEWLKRGYNDATQLWFFDRALAPDYSIPGWFGDPAFHSSHRAALLFKDFRFYSQYHWTETPQLNYIWPTTQPPN